MTATVEHLSWWNPVTWDYQGLLDSAMSRFADFTTALEPDQPQCPNEDLARADGTSVTSDSGSRVKWCYGESDGQRMLRLVNGGGYPALVSYSEGWDLQRQRSDSTAQAIGARVIEAVEALPDGRSGILLDGGQLVTLYPEQPPGSTAFVGVKPSSGGYILSSLEYSGSAVGFVADKIPGARRDTRLSADKYVSCIPELADTVGAAVVDDDIAGLESELVGRSLRCVARQTVVETVYEEFLFSAIEWLANGSNEIVAGARGVADTLRTPYRIAITVPAEAGQVFERFVGDWYVHGTQMTIRPDFTGVKRSSLGPCTDPFGPNASDAMCSEIQKLEFSEAPSGGIVAAVTSVDHETWEGNPPPPSFEPDGTTQAGDSFELELVDDNLLRTTWLGRLSHLNGQGNPYWWNSQTSDENSRECGA